MTAKRIKIMFAIGTLDVGGAERQLVELVSGLDRSRFEAGVCVLAGEGPLASTLRARGVPVHFLGFIGFRTGLRIHILSTARALFRMWRVLRRERPAIFHGVLFWAYMTGTVVARAARVPIVVASRRSLGHFKARKPHYLLIERWVNRLTDVFIANSEAVRADAIAQEGLDPDRVLVIYNGLDPALYNPALGSPIRRELKLGTGPVVVVVCNFIEYKGHQYFFEAWRRVAAAHPAAVALLVGDGRTRARWEAHCRDSGLSESVRFLGSRRDVPNVLRAADLFVHPSLEEGYSNAVLEAMASGLPVVATAVGGNVEAIQHGQTGLLVPARDSSALAGAMERLLSDPVFAQRLGAHARCLVEERFRISGTIRQYEEVYARLTADEARQAQDYVRNRRAV